MKYIFILVIYYLWLDDLEVGIFWYILMLIPMRIVTGIMIVVSTGWKTFSHWSSDYNDYIHQILPDRPEKTPDIDLFAPEPVPKENAPECVEYWAQGQEAQRARHRQPSDTASLFLLSWSCKGGQSRQPARITILRPLEVKMMMKTWYLSIVMLTVRKMLMLSMMWDPHSAIGWRQMIRGCRIPKAKGDTKMLQMRKQRSARQRQARRWWKKCFICLHGKSDKNITMTMTYLVQSTTRLRVLPTTPRPPVITVATPPSQNFQTWGSYSI